MSGNGHRKKLPVPPNIKDVNTIDILSAILLRFAKEYGSVALNVASDLKLAKRDMQDVIVDGMEINPRGFPAKPKPWADQLTAIRWKVIEQIEERFPSFKGCKNSWLADALARIKVTNKISNPPSKKGTSNSSFSDPVAGPSSSPAFNEDARDPEMADANMRRSNLRLEQSALNESDTSCDDGPLAFPQSYQGKGKGKAIARPIKYAIGAKNNNKNNITTPLKIAGSNQDVSFFREPARKHAATPDDDADADTRAVDEQPSTKRRRKISAREQSRIDTEKEIQSHKALKEIARQGNQDLKHRKSAQSQKLQDHEMEEQWLHDAIVASKQRIYTDGDWYTANGKICSDADIALFKQNFRARMLTAMRLNNEEEEVEAHEKEVERDVQADDSGPDDGAKECASPKNAKPKSKKATRGRKY